MTPESPTSLSNLFFYWLAALPVLAAFLVWFYFWRQKQMLIKIMLMRADMAAFQENSRTTSPSPQSSPYDKPPSYAIYETFPKVHSHNHRGRNEEVILCVEDLQQPPSYSDAVKVSGAKLCSSTQNSKSIN